MRKSNRFVLIVGVICLIAGLALIPLCSSIALLTVVLGLVFGIGSGAVSFGIILSSTINLVGPKRAMMVSGMLNAAAGMGSFALSPAMRSMLDSGGLPFTLYVLCIPLAVLIPLVFVITSKDRVAKEKEHEDEKGNDSNAFSVRRLFSQAFGNRIYRLLIAGFSTCGFHMVIIEAHLYSQFVEYGISESAAAWAFSLYGIFTIGGALLSGWLSTRVNKGALLGFYYGFRAVWVLLFIAVAPKNLVTCIIFIAGLGMTGDATVSPTSGLVHENFKLSQTATLIGFLFFVHQIGAFLSSWLGGVLFAATGGYELIWALDIFVCTFASIMSLRICFGKK